MLIRSIAAAVTVAATAAACTPPSVPKGAAVNDKVYAVTPAEVTVKGPVLSGVLSGMKVVERVEDGTGRVEQRARLTGKLVLTNVSKDQTVRLVGGKLIYIDMQGRPIALEDKRTEPTLKASSSYGSEERLDPGLEASQPVEAEFPLEALKAKRLKEIRLELAYIPSAYRQETMSFAVSVGSQP